MDDSVHGIASAQAVVIISQMSMLSLVKRTLRGATSYTACMNSLNLICNEVCMKNIANDVLYEHTHTQSYHVKPKE